MILTEQEAAAKWCPQAPGPAELRIERVLRLHLVDVNGSPVVVQLTAEQAAELREALA